MEAEVSTPRRALVHRQVSLAITPRRSPRLLSKRLASQRHDTPGDQLVPLPGVTGDDLGTAPFKEIVSFLRSKHPLLQASIVTAETDGKLKRYVLVTRTLKADDDVLGPHDALRLVVEDTGRYKCLVYNKTVQEGSFDQSTSLNTLLERMSNRQWVVCPGIKNYSVYKTTIGYDLKRAKPCYWPTDSVRDVDCCMWYSKSPTKKLDLCEKCTKFKYQLVARSKTHAATSPGRKRQRQQESSRYPFDYLSPASKKAKLGNVQKAITSERKSKNIERTPVNEVQNTEIGSLVNSIHGSKGGQRELERIFTEADQTKEGRGQIAKEIWEADVADAKQFDDDQKKNATGRRTNRWSSVTIRLALAIFSRSPSSYRAVKNLGILQLPCDKTLHKVMRQQATSPGINEEVLLQYAKKYDAHTKGTKPTPVGEGVLIWDEVKVQSRVIWNSANSAVVGYAMSSEDLKCLHDVYDSLDTDEKCQKTSYVIQFLWRDLSSDFDAIGPYFNVSSTMESKFLHSIVTKTMLAFSQFGFNIRALVCDGASSNLSLLKLLCGASNDSDNISPWFKSPFDGKRVFLIVCPSHQLKNMVAALYSSRVSGTKEFRLDGVTFGWRTIERVYQADLCRAKGGISRRVPGLKYSFVVRDSWTRLNVLPAKIMQQPYMITAIEEMASKDLSCDAHVATAKFLKACSDIFENGILSHAVINSMQSGPIKSMETGYTFFEQWKNDLESSDPEVNFRSPFQKSFLAWQTWDLLQIMYKGFIELCKDFLHSHPNHFISPLRINGSAIESIFSCLKYIAGGNLASTNYATSLAAFSTQREIKNCYSEPGYRDDVINDGIN